MAASRATRKGSEAMAKKKSLKKVVFPTTLYAVWDQSGDVPVLLTSDDYAELVAQHATIPVAVFQYEKQGVVTNTSDLLVDQ